MTMTRLRMYVGVQYNLAQAMTNPGEPHAPIPERMKYSFVFSPVLLVATREELCKKNSSVRSRKGELYSPKIDPRWDPPTRFRPKSHLIPDYVYIGNQKLCDGLAGIGYEGSHLGKKR